MELRPRKRTQSEDNASTAPEASAASARMLPECALHRITNVRGNANIARPHGAADLPKVNGLLSREVLLTGWLSHNS